MKKFAAFVLIFASLAVLGWLVWFRPLKPPEEEKKPEALAPVQVAKITRATIHGYVTAYGVVDPEPKASARLAVGIPGVVTAVNCREGQRVEAGAPLFEVDSRTADVAVQFAEKTLERQRRLAQSEGTSQKLLQEAEQQLAAARAQRALLHVAAPLAGTVTKVNVKVGEAADLTTVLGEVVDFNRLVVNLNIPGAELASIQAGQPVELSTPDLSHSVPAQLIYSAAQIDPKTGAGMARAAFATNSGLHLGQFVKARVVTEERKDRLVVPLASVARDATGASFIAVVEGEKAVLKPIKVGLRDEGLVEVEGEGIQADQTVVTEGAYGLIMTQQFATRIRVVGE